MRPPLLTFLALGLTLVPLASPAFAAGLTLNQAIDTALGNNPSARTAESRLTASGLAVDDAQWQRVQLTTDVGAKDLYSQNGIGNPTRPDPTNQNPLSASVGVSVPLFTGWKLSRGVEAAEQTREAARANLGVARKDLAYQVTQAFWGLRRAELSEEIQAEAVKQNEVTLKLTRAGFAQGRQAANEVDLAEVNTLNANGDMLRYQAATQEARLNLAKLLGSDPANLAIDPSTEDPLATPAVSTLAPSDPMVESRQEVLAAQAQLAAAKANVGAAWGDRWPQLSLAGSFQYGNNPLDSISGSRTSATTYSGIADARLVLSWNGLDNGRITRGIARAEQDALQAELALESVRRDVRNQIALALVHYRSARGRLTVAERSAGIAEKTLSWVQARYQQGYSTQIEVNQSIGSLVAARSQRVGARIDELLARAELRRALETP